MPILNVKLNSKPDPVTTQKVATLLTDLTHNILKKRREVTAIQVEYVQPEQWFIGGTPTPLGSRQTFSLDIKVTAGTNTKDEMKAYLAAVFSGMEGILGKLDTASYSVIDEVRADSWSFGGPTQEERYVTGGQSAL